jgi:hypothetical protein
MKQCIICGEEGTRGLKFICCESCDLFIPNSIFWLAAKLVEEKTFKEGDGFLNDQNFTFTQDNWMFYSEVVERLNEVDKPLLVKSYVATYKVLKSQPSSDSVDLEVIQNICDPKDDGEVREGINLTHVLKTCEIIMWNSPEYPAQTPVQDLSKFPHECKECESPAYVSPIFRNNIECSNPSCKFFKKD